MQETRWCVGPIQEEFGERNIVICTSMWLVNTALLCVIGAQVRTFVYIKKTVSLYRSIYRSTDQSIFRCVYNFFLHKHFYSTFKLLILARLL